MGASSPPAPQDAMHIPKPEILITYTFHHHQVACNMQ